MTMRNWLVSFTSNFYLGETEPNLSFGLLQYVGEIACNVDLQVVQTSIDILNILNNSREISTFLESNKKFKYVSFCPSVSLLPCLSAFMSFCLSIFLSFYLSVFLSFCLSIFLSLYLSVFLSFYLSVFLSFRKKPRKTNRQN